jgi:hypothetical protein
VITPTEWSAGIAALAAVGASAVTGLVTFQVTARQVRSNEVVSRDQRAHEIERAREDRDQRRKEDACLRVVQIVGPTAVWANWKILEADPAIFLDPSDEPRLPTDDELNQANAAAALFLSDRASEMLRAWSNTRREFLNALTTSTKPATSSELEQIRAIRKEMGKASDLLAKRFRWELHLVP